MVQRVSIYSVGVSKVPEELSEKLEAPGTMGLVAVLGVSVHCGQRTVVALHRLSRTPTGS